MVLLHRDEGLLFLETSEAFDAWADFGNSAYIFNQIAEHEK
jgi:hypothetical protein